MNGVQLRSVALRTLHLCLLRLLRLRDARQWLMRHAALRTIVEDWVPALIVVVWSSPRCLAIPPKG